jgi:hypothetical protein
MDGLKGLKGLLEGLREVARDFITEPVVLLLLISLILLIVLYLFF